MIFKLFRKMQAQRAMAKVLKTIEQADDAQIAQIMKAVVHRYGKAFPDWDILFLSIPKEPTQRRSQLEYMLEYLKSHHTY